MKGTRNLHKFLTTFLQSMGMKNDDEIVGTILSRRQAIALAAKSGFSLGVASLIPTASARPADPKVNLVVCPALEEGPFFVDEKLNRSNLLSGTTRKEVVGGVPLTLELAFHKLSGDKLSPFEGWQIDIWHCDTAGVYSDEDSQNTVHQSWLRGHQTTDAKGVVKFVTIFPGWYPGRTTHIHVKVRKFSERHQVTAEFTTQLFFHETDIQPIYAKHQYSGQDVPAGTNLRDHVFTQRQVDGTAAGSHLLLDLQPAGKGLATKFGIVLSDRSFATAENARRETLGAWSEF